ncbi:MAG: helix-turn-helix transcriptional regulator [Armatimonadetes bacterium]|nr:helix-turn-helix transcriptional regulator [Armatimonadota bacterium]
MPKISRLEFFRRLAGLNHREFAKKLGVAPTNVSLIERGYRKPWPAFKERAAAVLRVDYETLWGDNPLLDQILSGELIPGAGGGKNERAS